ncbi:ATP-binding protein [Aquincola sp. MAHUQ-54]|uniref:C4-dicarboxylate transport sensor protein DctB n=1 Tax=Aquincola agrisoli TaxID=3119538 RepID=A0AAW9QAX2_9BURK
MSSQQAPGRPVLPFWRRLLWGALAVSFITASSWLGFHLSENQGIASLRAESNHRLDLFASAVEGMVKRLEHVPATIQLSHDVLNLLRDPANPRRVQAADSYLRRLNAHVGSVSAFVLNDRGVVLASSNTDRADDSRVGEDVSFRPYFLEALSGRVGRHFAIGVRGEPGYFVSHPIRDGARVIGVAAIKISLEPIDQTWQMVGSPALLADANQVVIHSSQPGWRYTALVDLPVERRVDLLLTRMYNSMRIRPFPLSPLLWIGEDGQLVDSRGQAGPQQLMRSTSGGGMLVLSRPLDGMDWRVMMFLDLREVRTAAAFNGMMASVAAAFLLLLALFIAQRRRIQRQRLESRQLLERANAELEQKVATRTQDLTDANDRLRKEVADREQAEQTLRATQSELVHAAKMAVLGQLATGITHELTQPLGAIRTLSGNAIEFLKRGDMKTLSGNLGIIARLADQMGSIIHPLKGFARKSDPAPARTDVAVALGNALFLYGLRLRKEGIEVVNLCEPGAVTAWCDANRLEQVLINLVGNAIDAMANSPTKTLTLAADYEEADPDAGPPRWARIDVIDSGAGLDEKTLAHLFEPFFTTKTQGAGLGLGLAISRDIAREFGGDIEAHSRPDGGACFSLRLPAAASQETLTA